MAEPRGALRRWVPLALALVFVGIGLARLLADRDQGPLGTAVLVGTVVVAVTLVVRAVLADRG